MEDADQLLQLQLCKRPTSESVSPDLSQSDKEKLLQDNALQVERAIECFDKNVCSWIDTCMKSNHKPLP